MDLLPGFSLIPTTVTLLIGLPGSGKTTFLGQGATGHHPNCCFDDFHKDSLDGTGTFYRSKHYETLKARLREGNDCIISDIEYCRPRRLLEAENGLVALSLELGMDVRVVRLYFENNPNACRHNIVHRYWLNPQRNYLEELQKVESLSQVYDCPTTGTIPVTSCCNEFHP